VFNESSIQNRLVAGATVLIVFIVVLAIVATVLVLRTKNQDDLDKKTSNHLPLPLDYASNEGLFSPFLLLSSTQMILAHSYTNLFFKSSFSLSLSFILREYLYENEREKMKLEDSQASFTCIMRI
jgi:preprotein translocase subunit SecY